MIQKVGEGKQVAGATIDDIVVRERKIYYDSDSTVGVTYRRTDTEIHDSKVRYFNRVNKVTYKRREHNRLISVSERKLTPKRIIEEVWITFGWDNDYVIRVAPDTYGEVKIISPSRLPDLKERFNSLDPEVRKGILEQSPQEARSILERALEE